MHDASRRTFLTWTLGSGLTLAVGRGLGLGGRPQVLRAAPASGAVDNLLVIVNLRGGNDGLNMVVPLKLEEYAKKRPTIAIASSAAQSLATGPAATDLVGLHPAMPNLAALYATGALAIVQKVGYPNPNLSHFTSMDIWSRGYRDESAVTGGGSGWIARYKDLFARDALGVVGIGTGRLRDFQGGQTQSLQLNSVEDYGFDLDSRFKANSRYRNEIIGTVLEQRPGDGAASAVRESIQLAYAKVAGMQAAAQGYSSAVNYPNSSLGQALRNGAILIAAGFGTRVLYTQTGGFDTHSNQASRHAGLLGGVDAALGAFVTDLQNAGAWDRVVIAVISEFGRNTNENGSKGTDHGVAAPVLLLGGGVQGGLYGPDWTEADFGTQHPGYAVDFRTVYAEILAKHLGADPGNVFPEPWTGTPLGLL